ncbi:MAG: transposase, partial [Pyrinomonadaceae bacterium]
METAINPREIKGHDIARRYTIKELNGIWFVPSTSGKGKYKVSLQKQRCSCPDYELRRERCKHIFAAQIAFEKDFLETILREENPQPTHPIAIFKKHTQNWEAYNKSQTTEKAEFQRLLAALCRMIGDLTQPTGRPRTALGDIIFACVFKVFSTVSARRFTVDLQAAEKKGFISSPIHYNTLLRYFENPILAPHLKTLIEESSLPLASLEKTFAVDASGLSTTTGFTWLHAKFTEPRLIDKRDWLKIHICAGTITNIITAVEVTERYEHDHNYFKPLIDATAQNFEMDEISADKGYLSKANLESAASLGAVPYIAWKTNTRINPKEGNELWNRLFHWYGLNKEKFLEHYHQRSNVETCFAMIKSKFGGGLRSKNRTAQINEALCKVLAHNLCVLIQSMNELGIKTEF